MADTNFKLISEYIMAENGLQKLDKKNTMCIRAYCLGTVCFSCEWIMGVYKASPEEIADIYESTLPEPLKQYLY